MRNIINISLPKEMVRDVRREVKEGKYASTSEFFRYLLRSQNTRRLAHELKERREEFEAGQGRILNSLKSLR